jgi:hypothetical protein
MSLDTDLRTALAANAGLTVLVGSRIVADRMEEGAPRPFIVFSRATTDYQTGLDGTVLAERATFDVQCWADTRASAEAVANAVKAILDADQRPILSRVSGYDAELDLEATLLSVEWWD